jgi:GTPase SAR1 family protein
MQKINIFIIGDLDVGKTSLLEQYDKKTFHEEKKHSRMGIDCVRKIFISEDTDEEMCAKFWDTKGNDR